jgi:hypothetical protein
MGDDGPFVDDSLELRAILANRSRKNRENDRIAIENKNRVPEAVAQGLGGRPS